MGRDGIPLPSWMVLYAPWVVGEELEWCTIPGGLPMVRNWEFSDGWLDGCGTLMGSDRGEGWTRFNLRTGIYGTAGRQEKRLKTKGRA